MTDPTTTTWEQTDVRQDDGDHDRFAHYVRKGDIIRSNVEGVECRSYGSLF